MKRSFFKNSLCKGQYLHRFEIVEEYPEGVKENCQICHKSRFFKIIDGKVDNQGYMDYHLRQALPPNHPYHFHEFEFSPLTEEKIISPYQNA